MSSPILLVGAAGLVGRYIRAALADRPYVATFHRTPVAGATALDVTDETAFARLLRSLRPAVVILAAAEPFVELCERDPAATRKINVRPAEIAADICARLHSTLVVFSSEYVFDGVQGVYSEDDPVSPLNEYGRQKVDVERAARSLDRHLICRTSGVFGWDARGVAGKNFACQLIRHLRAAEPFTVPSDQIITPSDAETLAKALIRMLDLGVRGTYHLVGPEILPRTEFAERIALTFELARDLIRGRPTAEVGLVAPRPLKCGLLDRKMRGALGDGLATVNEGLRRMRATEPSVALNA